MDMEITFPGGARVDASFGNFTIMTDQSPRNGGQSSAPTPFATFLASIGTCAGIYVLGFLKKRGLATDGVRLIQHVTTNPDTGMIDEIDIDIQVPEDFPEKYHKAMIRAAELCAVGKHFEYPPQIKVKSSTIVIA